MRITMRIAAAGSTYYSRFPGIPTDMEEWKDADGNFDAANEENLKAEKRTLPKLQYPMAVATAARLGWLAVHGERFALKTKDIEFIRKLDAQENGNTIFGGGFLLSERAATERAATERAAATCFTLSERELEIQKRLG